MFDDLDLTKITGEHTREQVARLLNLIETLGADLRNNGRQADLVSAERYNACVMRSTG